MNFLRKICNSLQLGKVGAVEILIAMYPILSSYQYGPVPFSLLTLLIIIFLLVKKNSNLSFKSTKEFKWLTIFVLVHDFLLIFLMVEEVPFFYINSYISLIVTLLSIILISPYVNWNKLDGSINWVTGICIIGLVYQYFQVRSGMSVGQLKLPFLPGSGLNRYDILYPRPHSFFEEPAMYSQYMLVPLFIALFKQRYIWAGIIAVSVLLCSSTTGLALVFILLATYLFIGKASKISKALILLLGAGLICTLLNTDVFEQTTNKILKESTNSSKSVRLTQGPTVFSAMESSEMILGAPYANAYRFCKARGLMGLVDVYGRGDSSMVYVTTLWQLILRFGLVGLCLYMLVYIKLFKYRDLIPLLSCIIIMTYTASLWFGPAFVFYQIFLYSFVRQYRYTNNLSKV